MPKRLRQWIKHPYAIFGLGLILGTLIVLAIRFITYAPEVVHYHSNFAVFINGQRETFADPLYYEETEASSCTLEPVESPLERAHMHDNVSDVVHVEDHLVTWGNFFQNLNWGIGDDYLKTPDHLYAETNQSHMSFILNGKLVKSVANLIIQDRDKLLISYGNTSANHLQKQYNQIADTAYRYDVTPDPAGCSGSVGISWRDRLKHLF